jgi:hypothetical protein
LSCNCFGSTWTCSWRSRCPNDDTLATPSTPISRGLIVHRASWEISISDSFDDDSPIIIVRLVDDTGWSICGGFDTFGRACACARRSWTACRARKRLVPGSKISVIDDSPGTDSERMSFTHATPLRRSASRGTVIICSTSLAESPSASVCTSM